MKTEINFELICSDNLSLSSTCRTCLATNSEQRLTAIFDQEEIHKDSRIDFIVLLQFLNGKIAKNDGFPTNLCSICIDRLVAINAFQKQCIEAQNYLEQNFLKVSHAEDHENKPDINIVLNETKLEDADNPCQEIELVQVSDLKNDVITEVPNDCKSEPDSDEDHPSAPQADESTEEDELFDPKHDDGDKTTCPICEKTFTTVANRNNHMYLHSEKRSFACDQCEMAFKCKIYLRKHRKRVHTIGDHVCVECGMKFTKTSKYEYHLKTHEPEKKYKCRFCEKSFIQHYHRKCHEQTHHLKKPEKPTTCLCNVCGKSFKNETGLKRHLQIGHEEKKPAKKFVCDICKKEFIQKGSLKTHMAAHNNIRAYQCEQCGMKFTQAGSLMKHLALHNAEKSYQCEFCHESFLRIRYLRRHRLLTHGKTDVSVQVERLLDEPEDSNTVKHEEQKPSKRHGQDFPYGCDFCNRTFKLPSTLAAHVKTHNEDRKFVCTECGNTFKKLEHLKNHINGVHLKQAYNCEVCNKSFARVGDRNVHMRSHAEEKPHQCSYCGRGFHLAKALRAHTRQHTGERPFVCIICNAGFTCHKTLTSHTRKQHAGDQQVLTKVEELTQAVLSGPQSNGGAKSTASKIKTLN
ncbi:zinc finger protein 883-like isoform X1 [Armigeres subalbatus]|uniref:zinc finger protein 883-like isoform X1 n=1 Tax=Armigeres subalbatus TaxID=124917 RepID=UPI002ED5E0C9